MKVIVSCLMLLLGSVQQGFCTNIYEENGEDRKSFLTQMRERFQTNFRLSAYVPSRLPTKREALVGAAVVTTTATALYCLFQDYLASNDAEPTCVGDTLRHPNTVEYASRNAQVIHDLPTEGFSDLFYRSTGEMNTIRLTGTDLVFPKGVEDIRSAGFFVWDPKLAQKGMRDYFLQDLNSTRGGDCVWASEKHWGECNFYQWLLEQVFCISKSSCESLCHLIYRAVSVEPYGSQEERTKAIAEIFLKISNGHRV